MRRLAAACAALALLVPITAGARPDSSRRVTVFAASSLTEAFPRVDRRARFNFAGSNQLATQIRQGAPADVFASASPKYTQELSRARLVERPVTFAYNELVLVVPSSNPAGIRSVFDLRRDGIRLVVAAPAVPVGAYTREALARLGLTDVLENVVSREPDVKGVVGKVALGEADAGFVYATDAKAAARRLRALSLPARAQPKVRYELAILRSSRNKAAARAFVRRVLGPTGRGVLSGAGFVLPKRRQP
jgi:molybdate transport system substrate-binding protein